MSPELEKYMRDYREFKHNWKSYTYEEKMILLDDFEERLYQMDNKPFEI